MSKSKLLAFAVINDEEESSVLVFVESASRAKSIAFNHHDWIDTQAFVDLSALRVKFADKYADRERMVGFSPADQRIYWLTGWSNDDPMCVRCGRYEWDDVLESKTRKGNDGESVCASCWGYVGPC